MEGYSAEGCRFGFWELRAWLRHIGWCGRTKPSRKTIVNLAACDNDFEERFARFLQNAADVTAFAKLPLQFGFAIEYTDSAASLRYDEPDFVAVLNDGRTVWSKPRGGRIRTSRTRTGRPGNGARMPPS